MIRGVLQRILPGSFAQRTSRIDTDRRRQTQIQPTDINLPPALNNQLALRNDQLVGERFRVRQLIGQGGMGAVFSATDTTTGKDAVLKLALNGWDNFIDSEASVLTALAGDQQPHIVGFLGQGTIRTAKGDARYLALEYVGKETLHDTLSRGRLSLPWAMEIASQICFGLAKAAEKGVYHRDIKPANIMLRDDDGKAVLIDFGLARTEGAIGTLPYMSPQQQLGENIDPRDDIYSLGITLFEMLTSASPFRNKYNVEALLREKLDNPLPPIPYVTPSAQRLINSMTAPTREQRPQSYDEIIRAIAEIKSEIQALQNCLADLNQEVAQAVNPFDSAELIPTDLNSKGLTLPVEFAPTIQQALPPTLVI
ncbi:MAG: serine/threonine-protein kinase [Candidatus Margulisiibacteriota bacterium]